MKTTPNRFIPMTKEQTELLAYVESSEGPVVLSELQIQFSPGTLDSLVKQGHVKYLHGAIVLTSDLREIPDNAPLDRLVRQPVGKRLAIANAMYHMVDDEF